MVSTPVPVLFAHFGHEWIRGSERCLLDLFAYVDRSRFAPVLWCNARTLAEEAGKLDVPSHVSRFSILLDWEPPRFDFANYARLVGTGRRLVRRHRPGLIHSNSVAPTQWLFPVARGMKLPLVTHIHAPYNRRERVTLGLHLTTLAVGVTRGCVDGLIEDGFPASRTATIYNAVDLAHWDDWDERGLRARLGIEPDAVVITQVGSLIHRKGHDILLEAFAGLRSTRPKCHLLIVGDGPDRGAIEGMVEELGISGSVHLLGFVDPPPGVIFRDATDIAVSPSRLEGFGLTVIEAGAAGCAVVATRTTGMTEIVSDGESGLLVPIGDPDSLRTALLKLVDDVDLRRRFGKALKETVQQRFRLSRYIEEFEATYERLLGLDQSELGWRSAYWKGLASFYGRWVAGSLARRASRLLTPRSASPPSSKTA